MYLLLEKADRNCLFNNTSNGCKKRLLSHFNDADIITPPMLDIGAEPFHPCILMILVSSIYLQYACRECFYPRCLISNTVTRCVLFLIEAMLLSHQSLQVRSYLGISSFIFGLSVWDVQGYAVLDCVSKFYPHFFHTSCAGLIH